MREAKVHFGVFDHHEYDYWREDVTEVEIPLCGVRADDPVMDDCGRLKVTCLRCIKMVQVEIG